LGNVPIDTLSFGAQKPDTSFGRITDGSSTWKFFSTPTPGQPNITTEVTQRESAPMPPATFRLYEVWPNPAKTAARVRVQVGRPGEYEMTLFDVLGRIVQQQRHRLTLLGNHDLALPLASVSPGVYFVRVRAAGIIQNAKLVVME
jgi:hypothetical protein